MKIDALSLAESLDRNITEWTSEGLRESFLAHGCAVVREAVPRQVLGDIADAVTAAFERFPGIHVYDKDIRATTDGRLTGYELVGAPKLQEFLAKAFSRQTFRPYYATARRIRGEDNQNWQNPLTLHVDSQFHSPQFTVNFWVPFDDCGVLAPSLQLVPVDYRTTRAYSGYTGSLLREGQKANTGYFVKERFEPEAVAKEYGENCFWRPIMKAGDLIVSSNWILHGTYQTPQMRLGRSNMELRYIGDRLDIDQVQSTLIRRAESALRRT